MTKLPFSNLGFELYLTFELCHLSLTRALGFDAWNLDFFLLTT
jgi:hypothetical protein